MRQLKIWLSVLSLTSGVIVPQAYFQASAAQAQTSPAAVEAGYNLLKKGWVNDAIVAFQQAVRQYPNSLRAKLGLATAYQRAGQDANAWQTYQRVLAQDPTNKTALAAVGLLGTYRAEWQASGIEALTKLLELSPGDATARSRRALLYGYQGRFAESLADYQLLLQNNPKPDVLLGAAQVYTYSGDYAQGITLFNRYQATGQSIPLSAITAYATALRETGKAAEAVQVLERSLKQRTSDAMAIDLRAALAAAYQANGQSNAALSVLQSLRNQPNARLPLARSLSQIGRQAGDSKLFGEAVDLYRQVLQQTPKPSSGLVREIADVFSEYPPARAESLRLYRQLVAQQPANRSFLVKQLTLERQLGEISSTEMQQRLLTALQPLPDGIADRRAIAQALLQLDPPDVALLPVYQDLAQSDINVPFLNFRIAQILIANGDLAGAKQALAVYRSSAIGASDLATELLLADIERRESNYEASIRRYQAILDRSPSASVRRNALWGLTGVLQAQGRFDEALRIYDDILAENPQDNRARLGQLYLNYQAKRLTDAKAGEALEQWLSTQSAIEPYPELVSLVAALPADAKRESLYTTLLNYDPDNIGIERRLIQVLASRDPAQAKARVDRLLARDRTDIYAYFVQGELAQSLGDLELASQSYQEILRQQPENVDALAALGGVRFQQQRYVEATKIYQQILALRPNDVEIRRILAELHLAQDQPVSGVQQLQQIQREQVAAGAENPIVTERVQEVQVDLLKRRGFQPSWERY